MNVAHVLLTRFNLPSRGAESYIRAKESWLRERVELFDRWTVPSVRAQTRREGLAWIVYLDPASPAWLVERIDALAAEGLLHPVYREEVPREVLLADVAEVLGQEPDVLVTTNLDNDDGLSPDFSERVRAAAGTRRSVVYVDTGLVLSDRGTYLRHDPHNAFCSVAEPWEGAVTCWSGWHNELDRAMPAVHLDGPPGWLQVIHGSNVSNRVRGRLVSPTEYAPGFAGLIDAVPEPGTAALRTDRLVLAPARGAREAARAAAKRTLLAVGGRDGLVRAQERISAVRNGARRGG